MESLWGGEKELLLKGSSSSKLLPLPRTLMLPRICKQCILLVKSSVMHTGMKDSGMAIGVSDLVPIPSVLRTVFVYCESESEEVCEVCDSLMWRPLQSIVLHLLQE